MAEPLYSGISPNLLSQFSRQNTPYGLFGAGSWRAPASANVSDPTQQGGRYGAQLQAQRPSYTQAQMADLPGIVNTPNVTQEQALAALQGLTNSPTPNPVQANGGMVPYQPSPSAPQGTPQGTPQAGGGMSFEQIISDLGGGSDGQFPWTPPQTQTPAPPPEAAKPDPAASQASMMNYYDQIGGQGFTGSGRSGSTVGLIDGYSVRTPGGNGGGYTLTGNGQDQRFDTRSSLAQWLADQNKPALGSGPAPEIQKGLAGIDFSQLGLNL